MHIDEKNPTAWFEPLYANATIEGQGVPWAHMKPHPHLSSWLEKHPLRAEPGEKALVVGCGLGDDAFLLSQLGFEVTAFDVAPSAIALAAERFAQSEVQFEVADLFNLPQDWMGAFDFVLEIFTIQALPPAYEQQAIAAISRILAPGGKLLVVALVQEALRNIAQGPPWLLNPSYIQSFVEQGLQVQTSESMQSEKHQVSRVLFSRLEQ